MIKGQQGVIYFLIFQLQLDSLSQIKLHCNSFLYKGVLYTLTKHGSVFVIDSGKEAQESTWYPYLENDVKSRHVMLLFASIE